MCFDFHHQFMYLYLLEQQFLRNIFVPSFCLVSNISVSIPEFPNVFLKKPAWNLTPSSQQIIIQT